MADEMQSHKLVELFQEMSHEESKRISVETEGKWIDFHFEVNQFYYVLSIEPQNGTIALWSDDDQEEIFRVE